MPICQDEDGLAAVLGHEIAHVVARHPAERMSTGFLTVGLVWAISFLFDVSGQMAHLLLNLMYNLPNSRTQEVCLSSDGKIGLPEVPLLTLFIAVGGRQYWTEYALTTCYDCSTLMLTCIASDDVQGLLQSRGCCQTVSRSCVCLDGCCHCIS